MQQEILDRQPRLALAVYAVWFNMFPGDARVHWPAGLLTDARVVHYWDDQRLVGARLLSSLGTFLDRQAPGTLPPEGEALWDAYLSFAPDLRWTEPFPRPASWGYPILATREQLRRDLDTLAAR